MDVSDPELTALRDHLDEVIGPDHSETLVGRLPSTTDLATRSDVDGLRTDVDGLRTDVNGLRTDVDQLRTDVGGLRTDVNGLRTDVDQLRTDVDGLRTDVNGLRTDLADARTDFQVGLSQLESRLLKDQRIHVFGVLGANTAIVGMAMAFVTFG